MPISNTSLALASCTIDCWSYQPNAQSPVSISFCHCHELLGTRMNTKHKARSRCGAKPSAKSSRMQPGKDPKPLILPKVLNLKLLLTICSCVWPYKCWMQSCLVFASFTYAGWPFTMSTLKDGGCCQQGLSQQRPGRGSPDFLPDTGTAFSLPSELAAPPVIGVTCLYRW